jgi:hypothetical protein
LLHAWIAILDGREHEVPPFHGYQEDPLASIDIPSSSEPYILTDHLLNPIGLILFLIYTLWDRFFHRSESAREIQIPDHFVQHLKTTAPPSTFLSDNDVLTAWLTHLSLSTSTYSRTRPVNILTLFNLRPLFPTAFPPGTAFLGNALGASQSLFPDFLRQPLGLTACQLRRDLTRQRTVSQVVASRALGKQLGRGVFCGRSDQILQVWTNWHRARFFDVSFAGAVVSGEGRPVYITTNGHYAVVSSLSLSVMSFADFVVGSRHGMWGSSLVGIRGGIGGWSCGSGIRIGLRLSEVFGMNSRLWSCRRRWSDVQFHYMFNNARLSCSVFRNTSLIPLTLQVVAMSETTTAVLKIRRTVLHPPTRISCFFFKT